MNKITIKNKSFKLYISSAKIQKAIKEIAQKINSDYEGKEVLFIGILNGAFMFATDLLKQLTISCEISFIKLSSYKGTATTGQVKTEIGLKENIEGKNIIILEDIVDTGITIEDTMNKLKEYKPASIKIATLFLKPDVYKKTIPLDYVGIKVPPDFLIGYGLDYDGFGRNLKDIYVVT